MSLLPSTQVIKHSMNYVVGNVLTRVLGFALLPIYTRFFTSSEYGILSLLSVTALVVTIVAHVGLGSALFREVVYRGSDESKVITTAMYFLLAGSILIFVFLALLAPELSSLLFGTDQYALLLVLTLLSNLLGVFDLVAQAKLRIHNQSVLYSTITIVKLLVSAGLSILFIVIWRQGLFGWVMAGVLEATFSAALYLIILLPSLRLTISLPILGRLLAFGGPSVLYGIARIVMTSADRYFLQHYTTTAQVGLYSLGYNIGLVTNLVVSGVQLAWPVEMYRIAKQDDAPRKLARALTYYLLVIGFLGLGLSILSREVLVIMTTPEFFNAYSVVPLVTLSSVLYGVTYMTNSGLEITSKIKYMSPTIIVSAILNLALNYLLIPRLGMMGAAIATVLSYLFLAVINTLVNLRVYYIRYEYNRILKLMVAWALIYAASLQVPTDNMWLSIATKLVLLGTYPFLLLIFRFYDPHELGRLKLVWPRISGTRLVRALLRGR